MYVICLQLFHHFAKASIVCKLVLLRIIIRFLCLIDKFPQPDCFKPNLKDRHLAMFAIFLDKRTKQGLSLCMFVFFLCKMSII
jgi:hypothetical protein